MEVVLIQMSFLSVGSKQKYKNENTEYHGIFMLFKSQSSLFKKKESYFSLFQVMEFNIISLCLGKVKVFSDNSNLII